MKQTKTVCFIKTILQLKANHGTQPELVFEAKQGAFQLFLFRYSNINRLSEHFLLFLRDIIMKISINLMKNDVRPFIKNPAEMVIWPTECFLQLVYLIKFENQ